MFFRLFLLFQNLKVVLKKGMIRLMFPSFLMTCCDPMNIIKQWLCMIVSTQVEENFPEKIELEPLCSCLKRKRHYRGMRHLVFINREHQIQKVMFRLTQSPSLSHF